MFIDNAPVMKQILDHFISVYEEETGEIFLSPAHHLNGPFVVLHQVVYQSIDNELNVLPANLFF